MFTDLLGQPPTRSAGSSHLYVFDDVFVEVETDDYSNVGRFAITVRTSNLKPELSMDLAVTWCWETRPTPV